MRNFLKQIGFVVLMFLGLSITISALSLWSHRQSSFYKPSFLVNTIKEKQFDYIVLGASTGLTTLNTKTIDSITGAKGVNLAMDNTALPSEYLMLQHFLAQGKTTKYCILAPSVPSYNTNSKDVSDNDYRFLPYVNRAYVSNYYSQFESKRSKLLEVSKWLPMAGVSYYNAEIFHPSLLSFLNPERRNRFDDRGNYTYPEVKRKTRVIKEKKELEVTFSNMYVEKIKKLCEQNNIELICYFSPMAKRSAVSNNSNYTIVNHSDLLKNTMYFYDAIHVNTKGRYMASASFADELKKILE